MNYFGGYHTDSKLCTSTLCDAPCISMGRAAFACADTASDAQGMAMAYGIMRNRSALIKKLNCPSNATQAQVVLAAYQRWGEAYPEEIEGPCMSCVADREADKLLLVRDRMGECTLFFAAKDDRLVFSDHPDSILKSGFLPPVLDQTAACELFGLGPARTPGKTMLAGLESLKPASVLICAQDEIQIREYDRLEVCVHGENERQSIEHTRSLLEDAVDLYVPLHPGCMLSGGLDSTALTALLCRRLGRVESYSVDYENNAQDFVSNAFRSELDAPYVRLAAQSLGTRHFCFALSQEALAEGLTEALYLRGFPGMGDIDSSLMLFARGIARHSHAVLSGECGDEVFGGYPWFAGDAKIPEHAFPWSGSMELRKRILKKTVREKLNIDAYVQNALHQALDSYDVSAIEDADERKRFKLQRLCFDFFMPNLQERAVKMCEGAGLNVFTPLCDDRLVRYVYNVPWHIKTLGGMEKGLFRAAVGDLLNEKLRTRKKSPYPKTCSPIYADLIRKHTHRMIADERAPIWELADRDFVEKLANSTLNPADTPWFGQLMAGPQLLAYLLQINAWLTERSIKIEL